MTDIIPRIKALPAATTALIAAGEIIHGPKDVLKELLENALDAQATKIIIELHQGGIERLIVRDNGFGIIADDLQYAPARYTTSKLQHIDDLKQIQTYGFRGEALFSISAVSNFTLRSRPRSQEYGHQIRLWSPERCWHNQKCAMDFGTEVLCEHLFAPLPVRRQFLKSPRLEARRCIQVAINVLLIHYDCALYCADQGATVLNWPIADSVVDRLSRVFHHDPRDWRYYEHLCDRGTIKIWHYPTSTKGLEQYWYCHKRWFNDKVFTRLIQQFFEQGIVIVMLDLHRSSVDVNFHPQKHELDFIRKEGLIASLTDMFHKIQPRKIITYQEPLDVDPKNQALGTKHINTDSQRVEHKSAETVSKEIPHNLAYTKDSPIKQMPLKPSIPEKFTKSITKSALSIAPQPVIAQNCPAQWVFLSRSRALYLIDSDAILFDPQRAVAEYYQQQPLQDLVLPIKIPQSLESFFYLFRWRIDNLCLEAISKNCDRFWLTALINDFDETSRWYQRFYQGMLSPFWKTITDKELLKKSDSFIKTITLEDLCERLDT